MSTSRTARREGLRGRRTKLMVFGGVAVVVALLLVAVVAFARGVGDAPADEADLGVVVESQETVETSAAPVLQASSPASTTVEVPDIVGRPVKEAQLVLSAAGLLLEVRVDQSAVGATDTVLTQDPAPGELVMSDAVISVTVPAAEGVAAASASQGVVVCIDPGHQSKSDLSPEPIGPGATETKERVRGGTTGIATRIPEYEIALQISMNLKRQLEAEGITVVMTRTTNDVNVSNAERAQIANEAGAALFVRVHADGSTDQSVAGITTLYPAANTWTRPYAEDSKRAAGIIQDAVASSTGGVSTRHGATRRHQRIQLGPGAERACGVRLHVQPGRGQVARQSTLSR